MPPAVQRAKSIEQRISEKAGIAEILSQAEEPQMEDMEALVGGSMGAGNVPSSPPPTDIKDFSHGPPANHTPPDDKEPMISRSKKSKEKR